MARPGCSAFDRTQWRDPINRIAGLLLIFCGVGQAVWVFKVSGYVDGPTATWHRSADVYLPGGNQPLVLAAYPFWRAATFPPEAIPFEHVHQIGHHSVMPGEGGALVVPDRFVMPKLIELAHSAERTVIVDVGGATSYGAFAAMVADPTGRAAFIQNLTQFVLDQGYDGANIDWEFPQTPDDRQNLSALMAELRTAFDATDRDLQLSMAVSSNEKRGQWVDVEAITPEVDYYLVMTFGYYGPWSSESGHNAPLHPPPPQEGPSRCIDQSIRYWTETRGVPRSRILMGLPAFGIWFDSEGLYQPFTETRQADYRNIKPLIGSGYSYHWDDTTQVPYITQDNGPGMWSFDDPRSIGIKSDYVLSNGLGGVAVWDLTMDLVAGQHELLQAITHKLMACQAYLPLVGRAE